MNKKQGFTAVQRAWFWLLGAIVGFIAGIPLSEGLVYLLGYNDETAANMPFGPKLIVMLFFTALVAGPAGRGAVVAFRARQAGVPSAMVPFVLCTLVGAYVVLMSIAGLAGLA